MGMEMFLIIVALAMYFVGFIGTWIWRCAVVDYLDDWRDGLMFIVLAFGYWPFHLITLIKIARTNANKGGQ